MSGRSRRLCAFKLVLLVLQNHLIPTACSVGSPHAEPPQPVAATSTVAASLVLESTRRTLNITAISAEASQGGSAGHKLAALTALTPTTQLVRLSFVLGSTDVSLLSTSSLWVCHTLQPLPSRDVPYSRTECSPLSRSTAIPTVTRLGLEEAPGIYLLRSYVVPASLVVEPMSLVLGPGLEDFPITMQLPRPQEELASLARLYCTIMRDRIPQRVEGCAHKIVLEAQALFKRRLLGALEATAGAPDGRVLQHHLRFGAMLRDEDNPSHDQASSSLELSLGVDETLLRSARQGSSMDAALCDEVREHAHGPTGHGLAIVQVQQPRPLSPDKAPRLLCLTYTINTRHDEEVRGLTETWARRCDGYIAMSNLTDGAVPALSVPHEGPESYFNMWQKVRAIWQVVGGNQHLMQQYDFFFLGGDDVYLIPENLRRLLVTLNATPDRAWYLGRRLAEEGSTTTLYYQSGGAGYVLSREAVRRLVEDGLESSFCRPRDTVLWEDVNVGHCMRFLGIEAADTRDEEGRETFHYQTPGFLVDEGRRDEISPHSVSFHYVRTRRAMHVLDALLYSDDSGCQHGDGEDHPPWQGAASA